MKIMFSYHRVFVQIALVSCLILSGCQKQTPTTPTVPIPIPPKITATFTQPPNLIATVPSPTLQFKTPTATRTPAPTNTPNPPTITPMPKMSKEDAQTLTLKLIKNDSTCRLPCWWGITPGKTSWSEARNYLKSFADRIITLTFDDRPGYFFHEAAFTVPSWVSRDREILQFYMTLDDEIVFVRIWTEKGMGYDLDTLLKVYGMPVETRLSTLPEPREGLLPFTLILIYPDKGFLALYYGEKAQYQSGTIRICPQGISPRLWIWPSEKHYSFTDVVNLAGEWLTVDEIRYYLPIEDTISISLDELYQILQGKSSNNCFETASDKWTWPSVP